MEHDHMVQALPPNGTDHPLDVRPLPGASRCRENFVDLHVCDLLAEFLPEDGVAIAQQIARGLLKRKRFPQLPNARRAPCLFLRLSQKRASDKATSVTRAQSRDPRMIPSQKGREKLLHVGCCASAIGSGRWRGRSNANPDTKDSWKASSIGAQRLTVFLPRCAHKRRE